MAYGGAVTTTLIEAGSGGALFATELRARLGMSVERFESLLARAGGEFVVIEHGSPDRHIAADLRIVCIPGEHGEHAAALVWTHWLRDFLGAHRCG